MSNFLSGIPLNSLTNAIGKAMETSDYFGYNGAFAQVERLSSEHFMSRNHPVLCIVGAKMSVYYSAAIFFQSKGFLYYHLYLWYLYKAKIFANEYVQIILQNSLVISLVHYEYPQIIQRCQEIYCDLAVFKSKLHLNIDFERNRVNSLFTTFILTNEKASSLLKAMSALIVTKFPITTPSILSFVASKDGHVWWTAKKVIREEINVLAKIPVNQRTEVESKTLNCLYDSLGKCANVKSVSVTYLPDQLIKTTAG